jgi:hypothetical protein
LTFLFLNITFIKNFSSSVANKTQLTILAFIHHFCIRLHASPVNNILQSLQSIVCTHHPLRILKFIVGRAW